MGVRPRSRPQSPSDSFNKIGMQNLQRVNPSSVSSPDRDSSFLTFKGSSSSTHRLNSTSTVTLPPQMSASDVLLSHINNLIKVNTGVHDNFTFDSLNEHREKPLPAGSSLTGKLATNKICTSKSQNQQSKSQTITFADPHVSSGGSVHSKSSKHSKTGNSVLTPTENSIVLPMPIHLGRTDKIVNWHNTKSNSNAIPWIPRGSLVPLDHNRSNHLLGWKEKNMLVRNCPVDSSKTIMTLKSQSAVRSSFEQYLKIKHSEAES